MWLRKWLSLALVGVVAAGLTLRDPCAQAAAYRVIDIGPAGTNSSAAAINNAGQVAGTFALGGRSGPLRSFFWQNGVFTDIGKPEGTLQSEATGISENGIVAVVGFQSNEILVSATSSDLASRRVYGFCRPGVGLKLGKGRQLRWTGSGFGGDQRV